MREIRNLTTSVEEALSLQNPDAFPRVMRDGTIMLVKKSTILYALEDDYYNIPYHGCPSLAREIGTLSFGCEIEKEDERGYGGVKGKKLLRETRWRKEDDGSLGDYGFELISPMYNLDKSSCFFQDVEKEPIKTLINANGSDNCGGHIHVSQYERTPLSLYQDIIAYVPLLFSMYPNRVNKSRFCQVAKNDNIMSANNRYGAININDATVEFRIFPLVRNVEQLKFRVNLLIHMFAVEPSLTVNEVCQKLKDGRSRLHKLLRQVYSKQEIKEKADLYWTLSQLFLEIKSVASQEEMASIKKYKSVVRHFQLI
jgi:hypothetical protein